MDTPVSAPGQQQVSQLKAAGYSDAEISAWAQDKRQVLAGAGFGEPEINAWFGNPDYDFTKMRQQFSANLASGEKPVSDLEGALEAGWQHSISGLIARGKAPDKAVSDQAPWYARLAGGAAGVAGDIPANLAGFAIGTPAAVPEAAFAAPVVGMAAAFALPAALRSTLMDSYTKGSFKNWPDFWSRASGILLDTAKGYITGAATAGAGAAAGAALAPVASAGVTTLGKTAAEIATMTEIGKRLEGQTASWQDFADSAILLGGLHFAANGAAKLRQTYAETGVPPQQVVADANRNVTVAQDLASTEQTVPAAYETQKEPVPVEQNIARQVPTAAAKAETSANEAQIVPLPQHFDPENLPRSTTQGHHPDDLGMAKMQDEAANDEGGWEFGNGNVAGQPPTPEVKPESPPQPQGRGFQIDIAHPAASTTIMLPDSHHADLLDLGQKISAGAPEAEIENESKRLLDVFNGYVEGVNRPEDIRDLALDYYDEVGNPASPSFAPSSHADANSIIDPDAKGAYLLDRVIPEIQQRTPPSPVKTVERQAAPSGLESLEPSAIGVDAQRFQFKAGGSEAGVTDRLQGITQWDPRLAGTVLVWRDESGKDWIADGHQRLALAQRLASAGQPGIRLNGFVLNARDGLSASDARYIAAAKNIAEGTGTAIDAAKIMREAAGKGAELPPMPPRSALVRDGKALAVLSPDAFGMAVNGVVPVPQAAVVGRLISDPLDQSEAMRVLSQLKPENAYQAEAIVRNMLDSGMKRETKEGGLFGPEELASSTMVERAQIMDEARKQVTRDKAVFGTLVREGERIAAHGRNTLDPDANRARLSDDEIATQRLTSLATTRGPVSAALGAIATRFKSGELSRPAAARELLGVVRGAVEAGLDERPVAGGALAGSAGEKTAALAVEPGATDAQGKPLPQTVLPGTEQSAKQAAAARESSGHGKLASGTTQAEPGGLFAPEKPPEEPGLFPKGLRDFAESEEGSVPAQRQPPVPRTPEQKILDHLSIGESAKRRPWTFSRLYTNVFDRLYPIQQAVKQASDGELPAAQDAYKLARLLSGASAKADSMLSGEGTFDFNTYRTAGPSLEKILDPVTDNLDGFRAYLAASRALELEGRGIKTGFDLDAVKQVTDAGREKFQQHAENLIAFQNHVAAYLRDSGVLSSDGYSAMLQANKLYVPFQRVIEPEPTGAIKATSLQARNPVRRIEGSLREVIDPIESIIRNTYLFTEMAERNAVGTKLVDMLLAGKEAEGTENATADWEQTPLGEFSSAGLDALEPMLTIALAPPREGEIRILRDGKAETYKVDDDLARAMKGLDAESMGQIEKMLAPFSRTLRAGAVLQPDFMLRHTIRDFLYATVTSPGLFSPFDMVRGLVGLAHHDADYEMWRRSGAANISMVSLDRRYLQNSIADLAGTGILERAWNVVADPSRGLGQKAAAVGWTLPLDAARKFLISPMQMGVEFAENASHLGAFKKQLRQLREGGYSDAFSKEQIQQAGFASRDVAVDAARMGAKVRAYNAITAFANVTLQDSDRVIRALVSNPMGTAIKLAGAISLPSLLVWQNGHDDSRYRDAPDWEKDLFWVIPTDNWQDANPEDAGNLPDDLVRHLPGGRVQVNNGITWRIPKPWGMGIVFGSGVERVMDAYHDHNPEAFAHLGSSVSQVVFPEMIPNAVTPALEQFANRSTFTNSTLIPSPQESYLPEYQYTPYTSELAKAIGQTIGAFPGISDAKLNQGLGGGVARALSSPLLIENYVRAWSGNLGMYLLQAADAGLRKSGVLPDPPKPDDTLADIPFVRAFVMRYPSSGSQPVQDFYDAYTRNKMFYDTWRGLARNGNEEAANRVAQAGGDAMAVRLTGLRNTMAEQSKLVRDIYANPDIASDEKRQLIDTLYYRMTELAKFGNEIMRSIPAAQPESAVP